MESLEEKLERHQKALAQDVSLTIGQHVQNLQQSLILHKQEDEEEMIEPKNKGMGNAFDLSSADFQDGKSRTIFIAGLGVGVTATSLAWYNSLTGLSAYLIFHFDLVSILFSPTHPSTKILLALCTLGFLSVLAYISIYSPYVLKRKINLNNWEREAPRLVQ
ncbi:hypothetical protein HDV05_002298, partial [Chytridiales sp. JEL 0842]